MEALVHSWLEQQCSMIHGALHAVVMLGASAGSKEIQEAQWPAEQRTSPMLRGAARLALMRKRTVVEKGELSPVDAAPRSYVIAHPILSGNTVHGVIAVEVGAHSDLQHQEVVSLLHAGSSFFEMLLAQQQQENHGELARILQLVAVTLDEPQFQRAAATLATRLANELACSRVSIGLMRGRFITVRALSHSAHQGVKSGLLRMIAAAMEEAIDQDAAVLYPGRDQINMAHRILAEQQRLAAVCSLPLIDAGETIGAITFERTTQQPFDGNTVDLYSHVAAMIGPILQLKRIKDRWAIVHLFYSAGGVLRKLFGPRHTGFKFAAVTLLLTAVSLSIATGPFRVTADASLEGSVQRAVVAPVDGFILESGIRPGDVVQAGQLLGTLDDRELKLEQQKLSSEKARHSREYRSAMADHDRAEVAIISARIDEADAQLQLINKQLERMQVVAPIGGVIVRGDLSQSLGAPVARGDVLFEVATLENYRLVLKVDEQNMPDVALGQHGKLKLAGMPGELLDFTISRITPVSRSDDGANYYRVEASLQHPPTSLRPGLEGVGKIEMGERRLMWIWAHRMLNWLRLKSWAWMP